MSKRIERHREMAEEHIHEHQAMTRAHLEGKTPVPPKQRRFAKPLVFFTPQSGERVLEADSIFGGADGPLRELRMYWQRIPDFGIQRYEIFPGETGWAQVLYWGGTAKNGQLFEAQEADIIKTDADFNITRIEIYCDAGQWRAVAAFANDKKIDEFSIGDYYESVDRA